MYMVSFNRSVCLNKQTKKPYPILMSYNDVIRDDERYHVTFILLNILRYIIVFNRIYTAFSINASTVAIRKIQKSKSGSCVYGGISKIRHIYNFPDMSDFSVNHFNVFDS